MMALGIGELVLDKTLLLESYPQEGCKIVPSRAETSIGGPVASALILLSKLGVDCYLIASVGDDEAGEILKKKLEKEGVKLLINRVSRSKVHTVLVNRESGSRTIIKDNVRQELITSVSIQLLQSADVIILDRHEPEAFRDVVYKKKTATPLICDPSDEVSAKTIEMLKASTYPILPIEALSKFRRHEGLQQNLQQAYTVSGKPLVVTWGGNGSLYYDSSHLDFYPAYDLPVVDTLGAGDIYRGAFAYGLLQKWQVRETIEYSNLVAGLQCTRIGNSSAIPDPVYIESQRNLAKKKQIELNILMQTHVS